MIKNILRALCCITLLVAAGCNRVKTDTVSAAARTPAAVPAPPPPDPPPARTSFTLHEGTKFRVRLLQALDTQRSRPGDHFTASLDEPLVDGDRVVVPKGASFRGHIVQSKSSGRFKGRAALALELDSFELNGQHYSLHSSESTVTSKGHKKHHLAWIGGGSGGGAVIGAMAGGGAGALIGAGAGAVGGTVGSAITGKRQIRLAAETPLTFTLRSPVTIAETT
ncbi:MAG: hypothetical protein JO307_11365 [Bryobacterales bacterium]|nr:hypothetical protein [Bryobacterales bacterium]MBV9400762.1 hypothetical protein [Bryobacterales bacterium]